MKLRKYWIVASLMFMVMSLLGGNVAAYNMAEYFPLNQGDEWTYRSTVNGLPMPLKMVVNGTKWVNGVETIKKDVWMPFFPDGYQCFVMDSEGAKLYKWHLPEADTIFIFDPPHIPFPAQFDPGETYQRSSSFLMYSSDGTFQDTGTMSITVSLESVEDITIPAGTFEDCLEIFESCFFQGSTGWTLELEETIWYAHNVGHVKMIGTFTMREPGKEDVVTTQTWELKRAFVNGVYYGCPATVALKGNSREKKLSILRRLRDEVLTQDLTGMGLIELYYQHAPEISRLLLKDVHLRRRTSRCLRQFIPEIKLVLDNDTVLLTEEMVEKIEALLNDFAQAASPGLQNLIEKLRKDLKRKEFLKKFGIILEE